MKFLIIRLSSLGDIILTQPIVAELQARFPGCEISYVCKPQNEELVRLMAPDIRVIVFREEAAWFAQLRQTRYDAAFDLHGKLASSAILHAARAGKRFRYNKQRGLRKAIVNHKTDASITSTVDLYYSALAKYLGYKPSPLLLPTIQVPAMEDNPPPMPAVPNGKPLITIFPGALHHTKMLPEYLWKEFLKASDADWHFLILGSPKEDAIARRLQAALPERITNQCGKYSFEELAWVMAQSAVIISSDSGPMHLAAALRLPQIAIFGSTHPRLGFAPMNPNARIICKDLPCQPCTLHGRLYCPLGHFDCMRGITPRELIEAVRERLNGV
ncbi:MAG: glycosyltransferase family 9 protein [Candidatus Cloacimonetes bacterium]|nr:glycosyltransferase family 9 protein [Candidatus Cloacimonadota bacterium]